MSLDYLEHKNFSFLKKYLISDLINIVFGYVEPIYYDKKLTEHCIEQISLAYTHRISLIFPEANNISFDKNILAKISKIYLYIKRLNVEEYVLKLNIVNSKKYMYLKVAKIDHYMSYELVLDYSIICYVRENISEILNINFYLNLVYLIFHLYFL